MFIKEVRILEIQFKIETQLINMNQLASYTFSKLTGQYAKLKKVSEMLIRAEIERQVEVKNYFGSNNTRCFYEWHTNTNFDLGNIAVGEKFLADSINELGLWDDDRYITEIHHKKVVDKEYNYVIVTIKGAKKR